MEYNNRIKGWTTQTIARVLFEDAGYLVIPYGIEEIYKEFMKSDKRFIVPESVKKSPDFMLITPDRGKMFLLEVKYRCHWDEKTKQSVGEELKKQVTAFGDIYFIVCVGDPYHNRPRTHPENDPTEDYIKVIKIGRHPNNELGFYKNDEGATTHWSQFQEEDFYKIQDTFSELKHHVSYKERTLMKVVPIIKSLLEVDKISEKYKCLEEKTTFLI